MNLVFIHGRAQEGKDPKVLKKTWIDAWKKGLAKNKINFPNEVNIIFPYYGQTLIELISEYKTRKDRSIDEDENLDPFVIDFLSDIEQNAKFIDKLYLDSELIRERGFLNWEWVQNLAKKLDDTFLGTNILKSMTNDAFHYLTVPTIQSQVNLMVSNEMNTESCVVVGHSLGSGVGYQVLQSNPQFQVKKYITIGSPLGLNAFRSKLEEPVSMPTCVKEGWYNAFDERDIVALRPLDGVNFNTSPSIENFNGVDNDTNNRHGIEGYLSDATVAKAIYDAL